MVWKILRPRFWIFRRSLMGNSLKERIKNLGGLAILLLWIIFSLVILLKGLSNADPSNALLNAIPMMLTGILLFAVLQMGDILQQLFLSAGMPLLMRSPVSRGNIFIAKLLECTLFIWFPGSAALVYLLALGNVLHAPWIFYPFVLISVLGCMFSVTALSIVLLTLFVRILPPKRLRELLPVMIGLFSLSVVILQQFMLRKLDSWQPDIQQIFVFLQSPLYLLLAAVAAILGAIIFSALAYLLFLLTFNGAWDSLSSTPLKRQRTSPTRGSASRLRSFFPASLRFLVVKEWQILRRDLRELTNLFMIPLMSLVIIMPMLFDKDSNQSLFFIMLLFTSSMFGANASSSKGLSAFILEGKCFAILRRSPVEMNDVLKAKFWLNWLVIVCSWALVLSGICLLLHLSVIEAVTIILALALGSAGSMAFCMSISARIADFSSNLPGERTRGPLAWLALGFSMLSHLSATLLAAGLLLLNKNNVLWNLLRDILPGIEIPEYFYLLAVGFLIIAALTGLLVVWWGARSQWRAALRRLQTWEIA